jgi:hypothetical protein
MYQHFRKRRKDFKLASQISNCTKNRKLLLLLWTAESPTCRRSLGKVRPLRYAPDHQSEVTNRKQTEKNDNLALTGHVLECLTYFCFRGLQLLLEVEDDEVDGRIYEAVA